MYEYKATERIDPRENVSVTRYLASGHEPEHCHDFIELVYVLNGEGIHAVGDAGIRTCRGDLFYLPVGRTHSFTSDSGMDLVNLLYQPRFFSDELLHHDNALDLLGLSLFSDFTDVLHQVTPRLSFQGKDLLTLENLIHAMLQEYTHKDAGYLTALRGYSEVLLTLVFRQMRAMPSGRMMAHLRKISPDLLAYLETHYADTFSLRELAARNFYHPAYFSTVFKEAFGKTLTEFIHEKRMQEAMRLLLETGDSVDDICAQVGYKDKKRFYQYFKSHTGYTPAAFRKSKPCLQTEWFQPQQ